MTFDLTWSRSTSRARMPLYYVYKIGRMQRTYRTDTLLDWNRTGRPISERRPRRLILHSLFSCFCFSNTSFLPVMFFYLFYCFSSAAGRHYGVPFLSLVLSYFPLSFFILIVFLDSPVLAVTFARFFFATVRALYRTHCPLFLFYPLRCVSLSIEVDCLKLFVYYCVLSNGKQIFAQKTSNYG